MKTFLFTAAVISLLASSWALAEPYNTADGVGVIDNSFSNGIEQGPMDSQDMNNTDKNVLEANANRDGETMGEED